MLYNKFKNINLSRLGFGLMRLPVNQDGTINEQETEQMIDYAIAHGVNYFDTAWPYHGGMSEIIAGKILKKYDRNSFYLASKFPGHQFISDMNVKEIFEAQLKKCQVDYFDFYLLHNVYEGSIDRYFDEKLNIIPYLIEQKKKGRIKYLGFSSHGDLNIIKRLIDKYGKYLDFAQIQLNYVDWTLQDAKSKYEYFKSINMPVFVMEAIRGGRIAKMDSESEAKMKSFRPDESVASWALRYLLRLDNVKMILSGMSAFDQMVDNIKTLENDKPLNDEEYAFISKLGRDLQCGVPCTACKYCVSECPMKLDIPRLLSFYNDLQFQHNILNVSMKIEALPADKTPSSCLGCGKCAKMCPQKIDIPKYMKALSDELNKMPKWIDICKEREEQSKKALTKS